MKRTKTNHRTLLAGLVAAAFLMVGGITTAQATIVGATPNTNFANSSVSFALGSGTYTFSNDPSQYDPLSVMTGGSAEVTLLGGAIPNTPHSPSGVGGAGNPLPTYTNIIFGPVNYAFDSFPTATPVQSFQYYGPYIGLKFLLDGEVHYGYAYITDRNTLGSFAYNSVAGAGIVTGQAIEAPIMTGPVAVPEPSSLGIFGLGLGLVGLLGFGADRAARRRSNAARGQLQAV